MQGVHLNLGSPTKERFEKDNRSPGPGPAPRPRADSERKNGKEKAREALGRMGKVVKRVVSMTSLRKQGPSPSTNGVGSPTSPLAASGSPLVRRFRRGQSEPLLENR